MKVAHIAIPAVIAMMAMTGCKTTEANYRAAYEAARQKNEESRGIEGTIYERIRNEAIGSRLIADSDTVPMSTVQVKIAAGSATPEQVKQYSIVVNQFKQIFNARSLMERLRAGNYPDAFLLETGEPLYYVVAATCDDGQSAAEAYRKIAADKSVVMRAPFPWILRPASYPVK